MTIDRKKIEAALRDRFVENGGDRLEWQLIGDAIVLDAIKAATLGTLPAELAALFESDSDPTDRGVPRRKITPEAEAAWRWAHGGRHL